MPNRKSSVVCRGIILSKVVRHRNRCSAKGRPSNQMKKCLIVCTRFFLLRGQTCTLAGLFPCLNFTPRSLALGLELIIARAELCNGLLCEKLLQCPLLDVLGLVLLKLSNKRNGSLQNRALVFLTPRNNLGQFVDTLVDGFSSAAFNYLG
jgi:hypothetical protein